jgi:hypothetical protein
MAQKLQCYDNFTLGRFHIAQIAERLIASSGLSRGRIERRGEELHVYFRFLSISDRDKQRGRKVKLVANENLTILGHSHDTRTIQMVD